MNRSITKWIGAAAVTIMLAISVVALAPAGAYASDGITVTIDGRPVNFRGQGPTIISGRTLVPVRDVFEAIGFDVYWNEADNQAELTRGDDEVIIPIGSHIFTTNGVPGRSLDVPAQIVGGRTLIPLRFVLESLGYSVDWDARTRTVVIISPAYLPPRFDPGMFTLFLDGQEIAPSNIVSYQGVLFIPPRSLFENLGSITFMDVLLPRYYQPGQTSFTLGGISYEIHAASGIINVDGEDVVLATPPLLRYRQRGALYIPLVEVAELTGQRVEVTTQGNRHMVNITPYNRFGDELFLFINALNANGIIRAQGSMDIAAGAPRGMLDNVVRRMNLISYWNITNRDTALQAIYNLYAAGHNARYMAEHRAAGTTSPWSEAGLLGWDLARVAQVASWSFAAGYLTFDEFIQLTLPVAVTLQGHFGSWEEFGENFVYGAAFWLRGSANMDAAVQARQDAHRIFVADIIDSLPPWDMDLSWAISLYYEEEND